MACCMGRRWVLAFIVFNVLTVVASLAVFALFGFHFRNQSVAAWAFVSAVLSSLNLLLHVLYYKEELDVWYSTHGLNSFACLGFVFMTVGLGGIAWYTFEILYYHIPFLPITLRRNNYLSTVWALMTVKHAALLLWNSKRYSSVLTGPDYQAVLNADEGQRPHHASRDRGPSRTPARV
ncbi:unnamed protein product [Cyprideis torosa]|uniref:Uncharacterized protein n=1 Tax=Cyprideis torosa TaxID=163714 RepID=A0A7R8WJW9_9CRUS|nr:unnamed protein product [Cyprideis torosa]CAG0896222.1 unnamed protein product [Cyprideis torosa]